METLVRMEKRSIKARLKPDDTLINWISVLKSYDAPEPSTKASRISFQIFRPQKIWEKIYLCPLRSVRDLKKL